MFVDSGKSDFLLQVAEYFETQDLKKVIESLKQLTPDSLKEGSLTTFMVNQVTVAWLTADLCYFN